MAYDADQIITAVGASIVIAPKGTASPLDVTAAWGTDWTDLGAVSDDGVSLKKAADWDAKTIWQSRSTVKRILKGVDLTLDFTLVEWTAHTIGLWGGGGVWAPVTGKAGQFRYDILSSPSTNEMSWGFAWKNTLDDGTVENFKLVVPAGNITDSGDIKLVNNDWVPVPLTMGANATDTTPLGFLLTDSAAIAATATP
jgi:hypothetical protein